MNKAFIVIFMNLTNNKTLIRIYGFHGEIDNPTDFITTIQTFAQTHTVCLQVMDAAYIYGKNHILSAAGKALRAYNEQRMSTNSLEMETLLYAAGERQITLAIEKIGVKKHTKTIAVVCINLEENKTKKNSMVNQALLSFFTTNGWKHDDTVLEGSEKTLEVWGITESEKNTVSKAKYEQLILEKVAHVDILK